MADTVTTQTLHDSERNLIMRFTNISDGTGESAVTKVDISNLVGRVPDEVRIERIKWAIFGQEVTISWDASTNVTAKVLPEGQEDFDFCDIGGITNNAGAGKTGDILFTLTNPDLGDTYDITLYMKKKTRNQHNS